MSNSFPQRELFDFFEDEACSIPIQSSKAYTKIFVRFGLSFETLAYRSEINHDIDGWLCTSGYYEPGDGTSTFELAFSWRLGGKLWTHNFHSNVARFVKEGDVVMLSYRGLPVSGMPSSIGGEVLQPLMVPGDGLAFAYNASNVGLFAARDQYGRALFVEQGGKIVAGIDGRIQFEPSPIVNDDTFINEFRFTDLVENVNNWPTIPYQVAVEQDLQILYDGDKIVDTGLIPGDNTPLVLNYIEI